MLGFQINFARGNERAEVFGVEEGERRWARHQGRPHGRVDYSRDKGGEDIGEW